ncbi:MAG: hypothetical protein V3R86_04090 [Candidatus Hydrothermarchaeaceae archaeon]
MKNFFLAWALLLIPTVSAVGADFYVLDVAPAKVTPGETSELNITLKNLGSDFGVNLRAILDPDDTSPIDALDSSKKYLSRAEAAEENREYFGVVQQLDSIYVKYNIKVDDNATTGAHNIPLNLIWDDSNRIQQTQTVYLGIAVVGEPNLIISGINTTPERLYSDTEFTLDIDIENVGKEKAISVEAVLTMPTGITGEDQAYLGTIKRDGKSRASFTMKVGKTTESSSYDLVILMRYMDEDDTSTTVEKPFRIYISDRGDIDLEIAGISTSPAKIYPKTDFTLSVQLENIGTQDAKSVMATISNSEGFVGEFSSFVGKIEQDDISSGIFDLTATKKALPGNHKFKMDILFTDVNGDEFKETKTFNIYVDKPRGGSLYSRLAAFLIIAVTAVVIWRRRKAAQIIE